MRILILGHQQFGYRTDTLEWCRHLRNKHEITYLGWDYKKPKLLLDGIEIRHVSRKGNLLRRNIKYIITAMHLVRRTNISVCIVAYFVGCSLLPYLSIAHKFILDIRSSGIFHSNLKRKIYNIILRFEALFYPNISIISAALAQRLSIADRRVYILPVGATDRYMDKCEMHHNLRMLYIGALEGRRITDTIYGLREFLDSRGPNIDLKYTIVGGQSETALQTVKNTVYELDLKEYVECTGYIPYWETGRFFKQCNVGISYIPITDYYDHQPPTKTYEYLLSGMPVIATATSANRDVITSDNGVLIPDTISGFLEGLNTIYGRRYRYEPSGIRENAAQYTWTNIARELERYLTGLDKNSIDS